MATVRFVVSGRVQGVFFRASARSEAARLGIAGQARNMADGTVEVVASGDESALDELETWLRIGPPAARVDSVTREAVADRDFSGFRSL
jgi:acylphosphatase